MYKVFLETNKEWSKYNITTSKKYRQLNPRVDNTSCYILGGGSLLSAAYCSPLFTIYNKGLPLITSMFGSGFDDDYYGGNVPDTNYRKHISLNHNLFLKNFDKYYKLKLKLQENNQEISYKNMTKFCNMDSLFTYRVTADFHYVVDTYPKIANKTTRDPLINISMVGDPGMLAYKLINSSHDEINARNWYFNKLLQTKNFI